MADEDAPDLEIVGLHGETNGRNCTAHTCCGKHVTSGSVLRLVKCVVEVDGEEEEAVKCVLVNSDGVDTCTVGFVPRLYLRQDRVKAHVNKFVVIKETYFDSEDTYKRRTSHRNVGMASASLLDESVGRDE